MPTFYRLRHWLEIENAIKDCFNLSNEDFAAYLTKCSEQRLKDMRTEARRMQSRATALVHHQGQGYLKEYENITSFIRRFDTWDTTRATYTKKFKVIAPY